MSEDEPFPDRPRGIGAVLLMLLAGLLVGLAGLAAVLVLPMILVLNAVGGEGRHAAWPLYLWVPAVFLAAILSVVAGLRAMREPRLGRVAFLAGVAILAFFTFPPFWLPES